MDTNIVMGVLRAVVPGIVAYAVGRGWISSSSAGEIGAAVITLGAAAWSVYSNLDKSHAKPPAPTPNV